MCNVFFTVYRGSEGREILQSIPMPSCVCACVVQLKYIPFTKTNFRTMICRSSDLYLYTGENGLVI